MSDVFGRKALFLIAQLVFSGGTAMCGAAPNMVVLIIRRAIAGVSLDSCSIILRMLKSHQVGGGGLFSMVHICISDVVELRQRRVRPSYI